MDGASRKLLPAWAIALLWAPGCASYGSHLSATPVPPGGSEVSLHADGMIVNRGLGAQALPNPEVGVRHGISRDLDVGGRLNVGSAVVDGRLRLLDTPLFDLALAPGLGGGFVPVTNSENGLCNANFLFSVLGSLRLDPRNELALGARQITTYAFPLTLFQGDTTGARFIHYVGGAVGGRLRVGERTLLSPEINIFASYDTVRHEWIVPVVQGGLAVQLQSRKPPAQPSHTSRRLRRPQAEHHAGAE